MAMSRSFGRRLLTMRPPIAISPAVIAVQPGDDVEQCRLAAARGADQDQEFAVLDFDVDALQHLDGAEALATLLMASDDTICPSQPLTAPAVRPRRKYLPATT